MWPAAFTVLKSLAFGDRGEPKDAYDLVYVIRGTQGQGRAIAQRIIEHAVRDSTIVDEAMVLLARDGALPVAAQRIEQWTDAAATDVRPSTSIRSGLYATSANT